jgi:hypothetical protein
MALFDDASLVTTPNGYKEGTLYSIKPTSGLGDMTVVRATTATRVNSAGLIEVVPYNFLERSQEFNNGTYWGVSQATISANATVAPDGTNTADKLIESNTNAIHEVYTNVPLSLTAGSTYTKTVFAKSAERTQVSLNFVTGSFGQGAGVIANLTTGTLGTVTNYGSVTGSTATITNVDNGWYRISITMTPASNANFYADFSPALSGNISYLGNGTSGIYIWGAQLVAGSLPKDYLRTETRLNIPRLDYSNGTCPSLLVEPQRSNLLTYSEQFDNAAWTKVQSSVTANATTSPNGTANADKFIANTTSNIHFANTSISNTASPWTYSLFAKAAGYDRLIMWVASTNFVGFNLTTGIVESTLGVGITSANIEDYGNGWFRCSITSTSTASGTFAAFAVFNAAFTNGNVNPIFTGNGTDGIFIWGAQLELGSYPTSYIPTTSAAVTRNEDRVYKTGISSLIGQTEGVVFADFVCVNNSSYCDVMSIGTDGTTGVIELQINGAASNTLSATYYYGGFVANIPALATLTIGQRYKAAFAYKSNDFVFYLNGVQQGTDTSGTVVSGMSEVSLNGYNSSTANKENALINSAILFPTRLTNAELATLTTI